MRARTQAAGATTLGVRLRGGESWVLLRGCGGVVAAALAVGGRFFLGFFPLVSFVIFFAIVVSFENQRCLSESGSRHTPLVAMKYNRQNRTENPLEAGGGGLFIENTHPAPTRGRAPHGGRGIHNPTQKHRSQNSPTEVKPDGARKTRWGEGAGVALCGCGRPLFGGWFCLF
jgi:hypothetical protein